VVHELAVNATKYGALSGDQGRVDVTWTVDARGDADVLELVWRESGGPQVRPPTRSGFGSDLLRRLSEAAGTEHKLDFDPAGVVCVFSLRQEHVPGVAGKAREHDLAVS
jgi:two-component sensor histidine kinase